jgi:hypothetical protein
MARSPRTFDLSKEEKEMRKLYGPWKKSRENTGTIVNITTREYAQLWIASGQWANKGQNVGQYTLTYDQSLPEITIHDCKIIKREPKEGSRLDKQLKRALLPPKEPKPPKAVKQPKPPKTPRKKREVNVYKPYKKSDEQLLKQIMTAQRNLEKAKAKDKEKFSEADLAVELFYQNSTNPLNTKIQELAKVKPHSYQAFNIRTKTKLAPDPKTLAKYS